MVAGFSLDKAKTLGREVTTTEKALPQTVGNGAQSTEVRLNYTHSSRFTGGEGMPSLRYHSLLSSP